MDINSSPIPEPVATASQEPTSSSGEYPDQTLTINSPRKFPWKAVVVILLMLGVLAIFLFEFWSIFSRLGLSPTKLSTWNNTTPGVTTKNEVVSKLGPPQQEKMEELGNLLMYDSGTQSFPNVVIYDNKSEKVLGELVSVTNETDGKKYYQEMLSLGKPEKIMFSTYQQFSKIFIFPQKGITYSVNEATKTVDAVQFYVPTSLSNYLSKYGGFFNEEDKFKY